MQRSCISSTELLKLEALFIIDNSTFLEVITPPVLSVVISFSMVVKFHFWSLSTSKRDVASALCEVGSVQSVTVLTE